MASEPEFESDAETRCVTDEAGNSEQHIMLQRLMSRVQSLEGKVGKHEHHCPSSLFTADNCKTDQNRPLILKKTTGSQSALLARLAALDSRLETEHHPCQEQHDPAIKRIQEKQTHLMYALASLEAKLKFAQAGNSHTVSNGQKEASRIISALSNGFQKPVGVVSSTPQQMPAKTIVQNLARLEQLFCSQRQILDNHNSCRSDPLLQLAEMADMAQQVGTPCTPRTHSRLTTVCDSGVGEHSYPQLSRQQTSNATSPTARSTVATLARMYDGGAGPLAGGVHKSFLPGGSDHASLNLHSHAMPRCGSQRSSDKPSKNIIPGIDRRDLSQPASPQQLASSERGQNLAVTPALRTSQICASSSSHGHAVATSNAAPSDASGEVGAQLEVVQKQLATLQASGSALAVEALQGILSQLKHLSDQISNDRKIP
eukprot:CAMPEP_0177777774 /NCGR_PEP_ID=MMETSP0491_2-20121128/15568_1 /TAXON_ID=63592 /ORGANISM="Tetraselmis chuii, Strain PLY429" /LENGTH=427 /DNA_ID=CAMNT_0019296939 /DNA_START=127 /DNA_END=1410 /DNA_ORIENTATION=+